MEEAAKGVVAIFRSALLPGSETFVLQQAEALQTFEPRYIGLKRVERGLRGVRDPILLSTKYGFQGDVARALFQLTGFSPGFIARVRQVNPLLVHAHFATDGVAALPLIRALDVPLVVSLHGYDVTTRDRELASSFSGKLYLRRRRELWQETDLFLCVSNFIRDKALQAGFPAEKLRVHYTGVNQDVFWPSDEPRQQGAVLFVGRLVEKKGCRYLIDAMAEVRSHVAATCLYVIGDGPLRAELEARAAELDLSVQFLGAQPPAEVKRWLAKVDLFCVPSLEAKNGDSEGFGMVFAEAQAMGTPVVSFRHGGLPEVVDDGVTGFLVEERDTQALAGALTTLLQDHEKRIAFGRAGVGRVREQFSLQQQTRKLEALYNSAIEQHGSFAIPQSKAQDAVLEARASSPLMDSRGRRTRTREG